MSAVIEELEQELEGMDSSSEEYEETFNTLETCKGISYALTEGFITAEEDEDGEIHFFPAEDLAL